MAFAQRRGLRHRFCFLSLPGEDQSVSQQTQAPLFGEASGRRRRCAKRSDSTRSEAGHKPGLAVDASDQSRLALRPLHLWLRGWMPCMALKHFRRPAACSALVVTSAVVSTSPNRREAKDEASGADRLFLTLGPGFLAGILQRDPSLARFLTEIGWVYANRADVPETLSGRSSHSAPLQRSTAEVPRIFGIPPGLLECPAAQGRLPGRAQPLLWRGLGAQLSSFWPRAPGRCESSAASLLISRVSPLYRIVSRRPDRRRRVATL